MLSEWRDAETGAWLDSTLVIGGRVGLETMFGADTN